MINRVQITTIYVSDQDRALDFYVNRLGLKVKLDIRREGNIRWLEVTPENGETSIALLKPLPDMPKVVGVPTGIIFDTDDVQEFYRAAKGAGVMFTQTPTRQPWGGTEAQFVDPDGNSFSIVQRANILFEA